MSTNWEAHRRTDGSIDLIKAYEERFGIARNIEVPALLAEIEELQKINSRQAAAIAIATARYFSRSLR